jgi:hypothetical protein
MQLKWMTVGLKLFPRKTAPQVVLHDPNWLYVFGKFVKGVARRQHLALVLRRARFIKIPERHKGKPLRYDFDLSTGQLTGIKLVKSYESLNVMVDGVIYKDCLDMAICTSLSLTYDVSQSRILVDAFKKHIVGRPKAKLDKAFCESFFENYDNFLPHLRPATLEQFL